MDCSPTGSSVHAILQARILEWLPCPPPRDCPELGMEPRFPKSSVLAGKFFTNGTPLQCSCLENPMDRGAWWAAIHGVAKSWTRMSDFTFTFHFHALEKEMETHSSVLAWRFPGRVEPGGLLSMGSNTVRHDWSDSAAAAAAAAPHGKHITSYNYTIYCIITYIYK